MFTKLAIYRHFGRRSAGAATDSPAFPDIGRSDRHRRQGGQVRRRQSTVMCRWQINTATGKPERVWMTIDVDAPTLRDLDSAPSITPDLWGVDIRPAWPVQSMDEQASGPAAVEAIAATGITTNTNLGFPAI